MAFGLGTRIRVHMRTTLENGGLHNGQQPGRAVSSFFDHDKFEAMKMLSSWEAARCDKHQFCAKIKVSAGAVLELSFFQKQNTKIGTFSTYYRRKQWRQLVCLDWNVESMCGRYISEQI